MTFPFVFSLAVVNSFNSHKIHVTINLQTITVILRVHLNTSLEKVRAIVPSGTH